ncbi:MAG: hypothetical protein KF784_15265 [Fimbriimonadaceae bacterium]|nr:hypothetical protein [Fimbriimonadaceae bacterium]
MDDIQRQDRKLFVRELLSPARIFLSILLLPAAWFFVGLATDFALQFQLAGIFAIFIGHGLASYNASLGRRFIDKRYEILWNGCQERLKLFEEVLKKLRKERVADLQEMPRTIYRISQSLYMALRRADMICDEIRKTEKGFYSRPTSWAPAALDAQAKELYRIADKNVAEYRAHYAGVMGGVERTEAQAAVFMTTVDSLRMKMIGYRLVGKAPEMSSQDFLEAITETKMQLDSIDRALEELELTPFPKTISVMPPPHLPADIAEQIEELDAPPPHRPIDSHPDGNMSPPPLPPDIAAKLQAAPPPQPPVSDQEEQTL